MQKDYCEITCTYIFPISLIILHVQSRVCDLLCNNIAKLELSDTMFGIVAYALGSSEISFLSGTVH